MTHQLLSDAARERGHSVTPPIQVTAVSHKGFHHNGQNEKGNRVQNNFREGIHVRGDNNRFRHLNRVVGIHGRGLKSEGGDSGPSRQECRAQVYGRMIYSKEKSLLFLAAVQGFVRLVNK